MNIQPKVPASKISNVEATTFGVVIEHEDTYYILVDRGEFLHNTESWCVAVRLKDGMLKKLPWGTRVRSISGKFVEE